MSLALNIPVIETDRLRLRGHREDDLDVIATFYADDRSAFVGGPKTRRESWGVICSALGHWAMRGFGIWLVADKVTDAPLGGVGFLNPLGWDEPELGWHMFNGSEGKGYAFEAAMAAKTYGAAHFGIPAPISYIEPDNIRSAALAKRLGAAFERDGEVLGNACHVYRHRKVETA